jgi:K(+)-stimulated pyrophosphate-energized sodium pump
MNILIKLMSIVSLVIAPSLAQMHHSQAKEIKHEKTMEIKVLSDNKEATHETTMEFKKGNFENLISALQKDGIINGENFNLNINDEGGTGTISINGQKITEDVLKKYESLIPLDKKGKFSIEINSKSK